MIQPFSSLIKRFTKSLWISIVHHSILLKQFFLKILQFYNHPNIFLIIWIYIYIYNYFKFFQCFIQYIPIHILSNILQIFFSKSLKVLNIFQHQTLLLHRTRFVACQSYYCRLVKGTSRVAKERRGGERRRSRRREQNAPSLGRDHGRPASEDRVTIKLLV